MTKPEPYRPSNGTEGVDFMGRWCDLCIRDRAYREDETKPGCPIIVYAMGWNIGDPQYPKEWIFGPAGPECTAYQPDDDEGYAWATIPDRYQMELPL